ncbi:Fur family transcriptional regulator [uncultured Tyzzerella sp.]|uniref:Fur family transcriptional regulator n=1 Tax=uncultured Tyzzerella sp. TaxID=2321398 RepID=UPI002942BDC3|nr:Fur family transcriptional regulator [uncultured Tyzzerella sp.]
MKILIENLKNNNLKVTPQRLTIYNYLYYNHIHPSAETIYNSIKEQNPTISLATVYKTLKSLRDSGLVQEINVGEDSFRYDVQLTPHSHIICTKCNSVFDYFPKENFIDNIQDDVSKDTGFELNSHQMYFYGTCKSCLKK